jgi:hypothetical protein
VATYKQGQSVRVNGEFRDSTDAYADPTAVLVTIVRPDGQRQTYTYSTDAQVVRSATGRYYIDVAAVVEGTWVYWWHSTGTGQAADEKTFIVEAAAAADAPDVPRSLGTNYSELQRAVGRLLRISREPGAWQPNERADVDDILRSGLRRFYWHPPLTTSSLQGTSGEIRKLKQETPHTWSFLKPTQSLTLAAGTHTYDLPDDFGEMVDGTFIFTTDQQPVALVGDEQIRQLQSQAARTGVPKYASISVLDGGATKYQVTFYPTPDAEYTVNYTYDIAPQDLSKTHPYPLGGPMHAETIVEACLAAAEKYLNDVEGLHEKKFLECLARSIVADQNLLRTHEDEPWPLEDKAKGLGVNKAYLKRLIGRELGCGPNPATWNHSEASEVDLALETGLRKFYVPMVLPGERDSYEWKFLKPIGTVTTNDAVYAYDLPSGFISLDGPMTFAPGDGTLYPGLQIVPESRIRQMLAGSTGTGRPQHAGLRVKPLDKAAGGTTWEVLFYPPPDDAYELSFPYSVNPIGMDNEATLPYGGQVHAQTIIEACLTSAEEQKGLVNGPHAVKYLECLRASVSIDRRAACPHTLGYNGDQSDRPDDDWLYRDLDSGVITYGGQAY